MPHSVETLRTPLGPRSWGQVVEGLRDDPSVADDLTQRILRKGHHAVFFETCPVRGDARDRPFEFVVMPADGMEDRIAEPATFASHFATSEEPVLVFPNLSRTALLVVPRPNRTEDPYGHLVAFLRAAPEPLVHAFWRRAAIALLQWLDTRPTRPVWFSTAGWGVAWLHARLDETPKYYRHEPFRTAPTAPGPPDVLGLEPEAPLEGD